VYDRQRINQVESLWGVGFGYSGDKMFYLPFNFEDSEKNRILRNESII
jgi:hypothetical protein